MCLTLATQMLHVTRNDILKPSTSEIIFIFDSSEKAVLQGLHWRFDQLPYPKDDERQ